MANICYNEFKITYGNSELEKVIINRLTNLLFEHCYGEITYSDEYDIEGYFESRWTFPIHVLEDLFKDLENEDIDMRCLSTEWGCNYVAMNLYRDGEWKPEQTFDF